MCEVVLLLVGNETTQSQVGRVYHLQSTSYLDARYRQVTYDCTADVQLYSKSENAEAS